MHVKGLIDQPKWKKHFPCDEKIDCIHCKYQKAEDSIPKSDFKINYRVKDKKGNDTGVIKSRTVSKVTIVRGSHEDVIGFNY
jgi:hypothetical protein|tara:strand:+ start:145 stop:390 length:246 start_codon:yes stop_codon:yes gene_type:complete